MLEVLADEELYTFTGGETPSLEELENRYRVQVRGPTDSNEVWYNWILRLRDPPTAVGFVQATVSGDVADVAWVVGVPWQRNGFATEAAIAMCAWLTEHGVAKLTAHIHPGHLASGRVAAGVGLEPTDEFDGDRERVWISSQPDRYPA